MENSPTYMYLGALSFDMESNRNYHLTHDVKDKGC